MANDGLGPDLTEEQILTGWGNIGPVVVRILRRVTALETRLPAPIAVVTPPSDLTCVRCSGPVEPERHCYAQPTCYRCLPPPEPLPVRSVAPQNLALPDYLLAPAPLPRMWGNTRAPGRVWVGDEPPTEEQVQAALAPAPDYRIERPAEHDTGDECCMGGKRTERWCGTRRSESEQRVLDSMSKIPTHRLRSAIDDTCPEDIEDDPEIALGLELCRAELARREGSQDV